MTSTERDQLKVLAATVKINVDFLAVAARPVEGFTVLQFREALSDLHVASEALSKMGEEPE